MLSTIGRTFAKCSHYRSLRRLHVTSFCLSPEIKVTPAEEAEKLFLRPEVQEGLRRLVGFDHNIVFKAKPIPRLKSPKYLFMTDEELKISLDRVNRKGRKYLELVPFKAPIEEEEQEVLSVDPDIQGYEKSTVIFTDISLGATDRTRLIVVREPNGVLRRCTRDERHRMNQAYYPKEERLHRMPKMFEDKYLNRVIERKEYTFILDRACIQFEPDDLDFHRVCNTTFDAIDESRDYDVLKSNRYFGSLVFYLLINDKIDMMLRFFIESGRIEESQMLVNLYYLVARPEERKDFDELADKKGDDDLKQIRFYIENHSRQRPILERSLEALIEKLTEHQGQDQQEQQASS